MANITVDGKAIEAPAGAPLVEVLKNNGIYTSNLCYIDGLKPYAGCRSCLVDIQGPPGLQLSCTAVIQEGMVVATETEEVKEARKAVLSLILANHSDRCLTCHRREHCHPGDICLRDDVVTHRCLTCSKNYRCELQATCEMVEMSGYEPWVGEERSFYQAPQPPADRANPYMEFDPQMCIICTRCQRACEEKRHTGAITLSGKGWDTRIAFGAGGAIDESNCDFSGACIDVCPTAALMEHPNKWVAKPETWTTTTCDSCAIGCSISLGSRDGRGVLVRPGKGNDFSKDQICVRGRYHYDSLKPRERLSRHLVRRGQVQAPASLADAFSEAAAALKAAAAKGKVGVLAGPTLTNEEAWLAAKIAKDAFGTAVDSSFGPVMRATKQALEARFGTWRLPAKMNRIPTSRTIVVVADDLEESHNVASVRVKDAVVHHKAKLVVIGALRSELVDFAAVWLRPKAGEEGQMAAALADALSATNPPAALAEAVAALKGAAAEESTVICAPNPASPARAEAMTGGAANLAVALFGAEAGNTLVVMPVEANVNGLLDAGVAVTGAPNPLEGLAGLLVLRDDPTLRLPGAEEALAKIGTIVVVDNVLHDTAKRANVVIAEGRAYASRGSYTAADFRVQMLAPAVLPEGEAVTCFAALKGLGDALGVTIAATADAALGEIAAGIPAYQAAHDLIVGDGVHLSVPPAPRATAAPVPAAPAQAGSFGLAVARDLYTSADAAALRHKEADKLHRYDRIQVSEEDGARLGLRDGDMLTVEADGVSLQAPVTVTERVPEGAIFASTLLSGGLMARAAAAAARIELRSPTPAPAPKAAPPASQVAMAPSPEPQRAAPSAAVAEPPPAAPEKQQNPVVYIVGIGADREAALEAAGITTPADLLSAAADAPSRAALAAKLVVAEATLREWANRADLLRVEGIGFAFLDLLVSAGVSALAELAALDPAELAAKLAAASADTGIPAPSPEDVAQWATAAKSLPPRVS